MPHSLPLNRSHPHSTSQAKVEPSAQSIAPSGELSSREGPNPQEREIQDLANSSPQVRKLAQLQKMASASSPPPLNQNPNQSGLPSGLKTGIESLSGLAMDDVKVHYNSEKPAQLQAHAYAQGTNIHLASGQEKHLPHEAWHVVQQKQGRVQPTVQRKGKVPINDDAGLEKEADIMGEKAATLGKTAGSPGDLPNPSTSGFTAQLARTRQTKGTLPVPGHLFLFSTEEHDYYESAPETRLANARSYIENTQESWANPVPAEEEQLDPETEAQFTYQQSLLEASSETLLSPSSKAHYLDPQQQGRISPYRGTTARKCVSPKWKTSLFLWCGQAHTFFLNCPEKIHERKGRYGSRSTPRIIS